MTARAPVLLVGHSLGSAIAWGALDARVDRVAAAAYVGGWPSPSGQPLANGDARSYEDRTRGLIETVDMTEVVIRDTYLTDAAW